MLVKNISFNYNWQDWIENIMLVYLLLFTLVVIFLQLRSSFSLTITILLLLVFIGMRHNVGGDWVVYELWVLEIGSLSFYESALFTDPLYGMLNWVAYHLGGGVYLVNTVCAIIYLYGLNSFCRAQQSPSLAFIIALPYLTMVVAMGYTRQSAAIGIILLAIPFLLNKKFYKYILLVLVATLFHKSAIIMLSLLIIHLNRVNFIRLCVIAVVLLGAVLWTMYHSLMNKLETYVQTDMYSSGAMFRLMISGAAFFLFLFFCKHFKKLSTSLHKLIWVLGLMSFVLLLVSFRFNVLADRIGLYTSIIQMLVFANISSFMAFRSKIILNFFVSLFCILNFFIWLKFSPHAINSWIPYDNILLH